MSKVIADLETYVHNEESRLEKVNQIINRLDGLPELLLEVGFDANTIILSNSAKLQLDYSRKQQADLEDSIAKYYARLEQLKAENN